MAASVADVTDDRSEEHWAARRVGEELFAMCSKAEKGETIDPDQVAHLRGQVTHASDQLAAASEGKTGTRATRDRQIAAFLDHAMPMLNALIDQDKEGFEIALIEAREASVRAWTLILPDEQAPTVVANPLPRTPSPPQRLCTAGEGESLA